MSNEIYDKNDVGIIGKIHNVFDTQREKSGNNTETTSKENNSQSDMSEFIKRLPKGLLDDGNMALIIPTNATTDNAHLTMNINNFFYFPTNPHDGNGLYEVVKGFCNYYFLVKLNNEKQGGILSMSKFLSKQGDLKVSWIEVNTKKVDKTRLKIKLIRDGKRPEDVIGGDGNFIKDIDSVEALPLNTLTYTLSNDGQVQEIKFKETLDTLYKNLEDSKKKDFNDLYDNIKEDDIFPWVNVGLYNHFTGFCSTFYFPTLFRHENSKLEYGTMAISFKNRPSDEQLYAFSLFSNIFMSKMLSQEYEKVRDMERKASIKSAIAAIMSRNMSHNLGSHVITNTKSDIIEIAEANPSHARELLGLASLLHYLQERQDFIAVVTGDERYAKTGINFKAHVFDMLAYDGPALRHKTSTTLQQKNYILDNIVRSENYDRNNIELILEIPDSANKGSENYIQLESKHGNDASNAFNNIFLSIPYGINGRQGFLAILENFIRNSAKHEKDSNLRELNFTIRIEDKKEDNGKKRITIYDNKKNAKVVIKKLQGQIQGEGQKRGLLDSKGNIQSNFLSITEQSKHEFKGIKEMLICVAWLKGEHDYTKALDNPAHFLQIVDIGDNFGIQFELDTHLLVRNIDEKDKDNQNRSADIYYTRFKDTFETNKQIYPRLVLLGQEDTKNYENTMADFEELYKMYFKERFGDLSAYKIYVIDTNKAKSNDKTFCFLENGEIDSKYNTIIEYIADFPSKDEDVKYRIVFKNHYETFGKDNQFEVVADNYYLEGISGANYTHSLLRNGEFDEMKAMRIVESCQTKILVVDERMFEKYKKKPREERKKPFSEDIVNKILERKSEFHDSQSGYNYAKIADVSDEVLNLKKGESVGLSFVTAIQSDEKLKEYLKKFEIVESIINRKNYNDYFRGKNIDIATYNFSNEKLEFVSEHPLNDYHFVSIHYGLIEKFNAAEKEIYANNNIINALAAFIKEKIPQNPETQSSFVSIHSGRGDLHKFKDNNHNIITFIPLSGLEWAIENSKYTSTELFYSEIYKPITQKEDEHNK